MALPSPAHHLFLESWNGTQLHPAVSLLCGVIFTPPEQSWVVLPQSPYGPRSPFQKKLANPWARTVGRHALGADWSHPHSVVVKSDTGQCGCILSGHRPLHGDTHLQPGCGFTPLWVTPLWEGGGPRPALSVITSHYGHETVPGARQSTLHECTRPRLTLGPEAQQ